jgi:hypothetical protein
MPVVDPRCTPHTAAHRGKPRWPHDAVSPHRRHLPARIRWAVLRHQGRALTSRPCHWQPCQPPAQRDRFAAVAGRLDPLSPLLVVRPDPQHSLSAAAANLDPHGPTPLGLCAQPQHPAARRNVALNLQTPRGQQLVRKVQERKPSPVPGPDCRRGHPPGREGVIATGLPPRAFGGSTPADAFSNSTLMRIP